MNQDFLALLGIVIAGVVTIASQPGRFSWWETIIGIILCALLSCINPTGFHTFREKFAFWATAGLCGTITIGLLIEKILDKWRYFDIPPDKEESKRRHFIFFLLWILLSLISFLFIPVSIKL